MKFFVLLLLVFLPSLSMAEETPAAHIRTSVDTAVAILTSPEYQNATDADEKLQRLEAVVDNFFDSEELSKRALAQYWRTFDPRQKEEFQVLFLKLIKQVYLKKSLTYNGEVVVYNQEILKSETLAEVHTNLTSPSLNIPIIYYLIRKGVTWKVYDVSIENVSLVKNYRSQFQSMLQNSAPDQLIAILREKTNA